MKKQINYLGFIFLLCVIASCKETKKADQRVEQAAAQACLSQEDTATIIRMTTTYLEHLKNKEFDEAAQMLFHIRRDSISAFTSEEKERIKQQYTTFPVLSYSIDDYFFRDQIHTEVVYSIEFFRKEEGDNRPNTMKFRLHPQKINGTWYLSLLNR